MLIWYIRLDKKIGLRKQWDWVALHCLPTFSYHIKNILNVYLCISWFTCSDSFFDILDLIGKLIAWTIRLSSFKLFAGSILSYDLY